MGSQAKDLAKPHAAWERALRALVLLLVVIVASPVAVEGANAAHAHRTSACSSVEAHACSPTLEADASGPASDDHERSCIVCAQHAWSDEVRRVSPAGERTSVHAASPLPGPVDLIAGRCVEPARRPPRA